MTVIHRLSTLRLYHRLTALMRRGRTLKEATSAAGVGYEAGKKIVQRCGTDRRCRDRRHAVRTMSVQRRDGRERRVAGPCEVEPSA